jgi:hypothetical protein
MVTKAITQPVLNSPSWGQPLNDNFAAIATAFGNSVDILSTTGPVPLTVEQVGHMCLRCTGALSGDLTLQVPNGTAGQWVVVNATTDAVLGTLRTVSITRGTDLNPIQIARGSARSVYADGTNQVVFADTIIIPGSDNQIIYNDAGALTGSSNLTFDGTAVSVGGSTATTGASWSSGTATVTFNNGKSIPVGSVVSIAGVVPSGYNGSWVTTGTETANQVQFAVASNPGLYTTAGTISYGNLNLGGSLIGGIASEDLAEAGTNNTAIMTPLSTAQGIVAKLNAGGDAPMYACRAWVNFNGTINPVFIRGSGNISRVDRVSQGIYDVFFQTPMQDINYAVSLSYSGEIGAVGIVMPPTSAGTVRLIFQYPTDGSRKADKSFVAVAIFR